MKNRFHRLLQIVLFALLLAGDQLTKRWVVLHLQNQPPAVLIPGVLEFVYTENTGAAFSSFQGMNTVLLVVGLVMIAAICFFVFRIPGERKWRPLQYTLVLLAAGGLGNIIDRIVRGFVVDFIYFVPINFPKFNLSDSYIIISIVFLFFLVAFKHKNDSFRQIFKTEKKSA